MQPIKNIVQLRQFLAERLPNLRGFTAVAGGNRGESRGFTQFDNLLPGALANGSVTEVVGSNPSSGSAFLIRSLVRRAHEMGQWLVLVDGLDCFDPTSLEREVLSRLLWVRCGDATEALKATDLLLRDENLPTIVLDLQLNPAGQLRKIPASVWYRFQRLIEHHFATLLVFTPEALVGAARGRVFLRNHFGLAALHKPEEQLFAQFRVEVTRLDGKEISSGSESAAQTG